MSIAENIKKSTWEIKLYPDCDRHKEILDELYLSLCADPHSCDFVGILHDKCKNEDGTLKKAHHHIILCYDNTVSLGQVASRFPNLETNNIIGKDNRKQSLLYLTHQSVNARAEGKTLYDQSALYGNPNIIAKAYKVDVSASLETIMQWIRVTPSREANFTNLMIFCIHNGITDTLRKYSFLIKEIMREKQTKSLELLHNIDSLIMKSARDQRIENISEVYGI